VYCDGKSRERILEGTTAVKMQDIYSRPHRNSIYEPATARDIPFETLKEGLLYLVKDCGSDLLFASLVCRAWRAVALELMSSRKRIVKNKEEVGRFVCGLHLRSIVGLERATIKYLSLNVEIVEKEYIDRIAQYVAPTLTSLLLLCGDQDPSDCYETLEVFLSRCDGIRNLRLYYFDFGTDPTSITPAIKNGMSRLRQLDLIECLGDIRMFVETNPIHKLQILFYQSNREAGEEDQIISSLASSYKTLKSVHLYVKFESPASLLKIVECCRDLESLMFGNRGGGIILARSNILAIAFFRLKELMVGIRMADDAYSALKRCRLVKSLYLILLVDTSILSTIGRNLASLTLVRPSNEVVDAIVECCPNLQNLELYIIVFDLLPWSGYCLWSVDY
jgi:hypothetical protein